MADYDPQNIFAKILRGEIPCHKIIEDDVALGFMDVMPRSEGHCLVIPKAPARTLLDLAPDLYAALALRVQRVARAASEVFAVDGLTIQQFNEAAGGQEVFHLHVHVLPRRSGVPLKPPGGPMAEGSLLAAQAETMRAALSRSA
ncbi:HIT family protein [Lichenihabitans sp. Uapishka_5]|uniref:HIT family protein n=1 Tax=Lichenihabitans sp. Uapishka_5 TaxID=3037302 RepID=UPI0029E7CD80|nr:HIT family protein [Lichenihabitans sp. Uapishka_5]MDX7952306.1 HIT family protein [Lichenihabitans sp. Uapishka_5]